MLAPFPARRPLASIPLVYSQVPIDRVALDLVVLLTERFGKRRSELLAARYGKRLSLSQGHVALQAGTAHVRRAQWTVAPLPAQLLERRVELIGGASRRELIDGLNSGAKSYVADLHGLALNDEASILMAHRHLQRAARLEVTCLDAHGGRLRVNPSTGTRLMVVPRPLHQTDHTLSISYGEVPAAFFDLALFCAGAARIMIERQGALGFYLRGVHDHVEARLWNELFATIEERLDLGRGSIRATVMIDSVSAALETDEILFELMHHTSGLSLDPQAYAVDHIALFSAKERAAFPDRERIGMNAHMLRSLSLAIIGTCHRRQAHAIGAPSYALPLGEDGASASVVAEMLRDKEREAMDGHDGTLVAHPGLVNAASVEFNKGMPKAHQFYYQRKDDIHPADLVEPPTGEITAESLATSIRTVLRAFGARRPVVEGGRSHDRSSVLLALSLIWQWCHSRGGEITASGLDVHDDLVKFIARKEARRLFGDDTIATRAADRSIDLVLAEAPPTDPFH